MYTVIRRSRIRGLAGFGRQAVRSTHRLAAASRWPRSGCCSQAAPGRTWRVHARFLCWDAVTTCPPHMVGFSG